MAELAPVFKQRFFDANGEPLAGGKVFTYAATTSVPKSTFTDQSGVTPNPNPVVLDANGEADIWLGSGNYKIVLTNSLDVTQWTVDDVTAPSATSSSTNSGWNTHTVVDGQVATDLATETIDFDDNSSAIYDVEIIRGTTVIANGPLAIQNLNATARVVLGGLLTEEAHGVTFTVSQAGTVATLRAALDVGAGNGTIKLSRRLIPA